MKHHSPKHCERYGSLADCFTGACYDSKRGFISGLPFTAKDRPDFLPLRRSHNYVGILDNALCDVESIPDFERHAGTSSRPSIRVVPTTPNSPTRLRFIHRSKGKSKLPGFTEFEPYVLLTSAASSLDALSACIFLANGGEIKNPRSTPGISDIQKRLTQYPHSLTAINELRDSPWVETLIEARHNILHRGFWPVWMEASGACLQRRTLSNYPGPDHYEKFDLDQIVKGLLTDLEAWDVSLESRIKNEVKGDAVAGALTMEIVISSGTIKSAKHENPPLPVDFDAQNRHFRSSRHLIEHKLKPREVVASGDFKSMKNNIRIKFDKIMAILIVRLNISHPLKSSN